MDVLASLVTHYAMDELNHQMTLHRRCVLSLLKYSAEEIIVPEHLLANGRIPPERRNRMCYDPFRWNLVNKLRADIVETRQMVLHLEILFKIHANHPLRDYLLFDSNGSDGEDFMESYEQVLKDEETPLERIQYGRDVYNKHAFIFRIIQFCPRDGLK